MNKTKTNLALGGMVLMIVLSVLLGGYRSLTSLKSKVSDVFVSGQNDEPAIVSRLQNICDETINLCSTAKRYYPAGDPDIVAVETARDALLAANSPKEKYTAMNTLYAASSQLYYKLTSDTPDISEKHKNDAVINHTNIQSQMDKITHSSYNEAAQEFNRKLDTFPASVLSGLTGVTDAELFA